LYFRIAGDSAQLVDPQDVASLSVQCPENLGHDDLVATVRRADLGELLPGDSHLMVPLDTIRRMAADQVGPGWSDDFAKMISYAASKGWTSEDGTQVRAHIERG
jgi:hypothetical protein